VLVNEMGNLQKPNNHRSVYQLMLRSAMPLELSAFNLPDGFKVKGKRDITTLPTQALYLLNNPFVVQRSKDFASRVLGDSSDTAATIRQAFRRAFLRTPTADETQEATLFLSKRKRIFPNSTRIQTSADRKRGLPSARPFWRVTN